MNGGIGTTGSTSKHLASASSTDETNLWSTILDSVKGTRGTVGTKQCIILGAPRSGKTTLVQRISSTNGEPLRKLAEEAGEPTLDLGMSYSVLEVKDEGSGEEETLARLSLYQLPSASPPFPALLPLSLSKATLPDSLVVIVLDWEKPWDWLRQLEEWIQMLKETLEKEIGKDGYEATEAKERVERFLRNYHEPAQAQTTSTNGSSIPSTTSTMTTSTVLDNDSPLPSGTLIENLGLPIIVVCTKADHINTLEREREFTEEQFDYIQQTLRTICLRYGASLFFTSQTLPSSFLKLRQYILHRLFSTPSPTASTTVTASSSLPSSSTSNPSSTTATTTTNTASRRAFPFLHKANVIDRDQISVPSGWDSWGKIKILREKFDCENVGERWDRDIDSSRKRTDTEEEDVGGEGGLIKEYGMIVVDFESEDNRPKNGSASSLVSPTPEQSFLATHYASLQADLEKDPRLAFRQQQSHPSSSSTSSSTAGRNGVVGPMSGVISDLPNVQGALERASGGSTSASGGTKGEKERERGSSSTSSNTRTALGGGSSGMTRQGSSSSANLPSSTNLPSSSRSPVLPPSSAQPAFSTPTSSSTSTTNTPSATAGSSAAGGNQVLADFFQSLLQNRSAAASSSTGTPKAGTPGAPAAPRRPSESTEQQEGK